MRFGLSGKEIPGVQLENGKRIEISGFGEDFDEFFFGGDGIERLRDWLVRNKETCSEISKDTRVGPPLVRPSKIICVGLNYAEHARESGMAIPKEPVLFFKSTSAIVGPNDDLVIPKNSKKTDWEVELAIVIGKRASHISKVEAMEHIAGYVLHNDYSEREFQLEKEGQWCKGKGCDTFAPLGPFIATRDELPNPNHLNLWLKLNGELVQNSNTEDFIFDVAHVVSYISEYMTLLPGDIVSTGTPFGVGLGFKPARYLKPGDVVELGIEGLGESRQLATSFK